MPPTPPINVAAVFAKIKARKDPNFTKKFGAPVATSGASAYAVIQELEGRGASVAPLPAPGAQPNRTAAAPPANRTAPVTVARTGTPVTSKAATTTLPTRPTAQTTGTGPAKVVPRAGATATSKTKATGPGAAR